MVDNNSKTEVKFNQAGYQQERINDLMRVINFCWTNPIKFNEAFQDYNYRVIFQVLTSYYTEIRVKLKLEREEIDELRKNLDNYMERNPIVSMRKTSSMYDSDKKGIHFDQKSWAVIKEGLILFQNKILDAAESHGMGNPNKKDITRAVIDM